MKKTHKLETVDLVKAYDQLSQEAFSVWMRLHMLGDDKLALGHKKLCRIVGYSEARYIVILRDLRNAGYVKFLPAERPGLPTTLLMLKVCKLSGKNRFVKLSVQGSGCACSSSHEEENLSIPFAQSLFANLTVNEKQFTENYQANRHASSEDYEVTGAQKQFDGNHQFCVPEDGSGNSEFTIGKFNYLCAQHGLSNKHDDNLSIGESNMSDDSSKGDNSKKKVKFLTFDGDIKHASETTHKSKTNISYTSLNSGINISKYSKERRTKRVLERPKHPDSGKPINWGKLDQLGKPAITFNLSESEREELIRLLVPDMRKLSSEDKKFRRAVERKLEQEFVRLYERYRRAAMREMGWGTTKYDVMSKERKYALAAAISCVVKGVTPRQVFQYWHKNIKHFANSKLSVPPLPFLSQPANIDEVCINMMEEKHSGPKRHDSGRPRSMHTMSDTSLLDPRFRKTLAEVGFDLSGMNDVYLATVQAYAVDVAGGQVKARFIPSKLREMVKWAADNFFADKNLDDYI